MARKIGSAGIALIKSFEGCRLTAYKPVVTETYWTIGWGHYGPDVKEGATITQAEADAMLVTDLAKYEAYVNSASYVPVTAELTQNQFDALTSFCYNCGNGNLRTLCKGRTVAEIGANLTKYDKAGGKVLAGLTRRRAAELALFNTKEEDDEMTAEEKAKFDALQTKVDEQAAVIAALAVRLNLNGDQTYASAYSDAIVAAKKAGAITTSADKSKIELNVIQMLYNLGIFAKEAA